MVFAVPAYRAAAPFPLYVDHEHRDGGVVRVVLDTVPRASASLPLSVNVRLCDPRGLSGRAV